MAKTRLLYHLTLLRHGESIGNAENRLQGQADFPLSELGREQARKLAARWLKENLKFDSAISSPLRRAFETAQIISETLDIPNLETDPLWMERDMGQHSGLRMDEVQTHFPEREFVNLYEAWSEQGESDWALYLRGGQALHKLLQRPPARYLVVAHGAILNKVFYSILGIPPQPNRQGAQFRLTNTAFSTFTYHPQTHRWQVETLGDAHHLDGR